MANFTTNLTITTPKETTSASLGGSYTEVFSLSQLLDNNTSLISILSNATAIGSLTLSDCKTLMIKNSGAVGAELNILLNGWTNATPDSDTSPQYVSILLGSGDFIMLPNLRVLGYSTSDSAGDAFQLDNLVPSSNMYIAVNNPAAGDAQLIAEALDNSEEGVDVDDGNFFYVGDLIRIEDEIMEVTSISGNTLTVTRGTHGSAKATHVDDSAIRYPFFNAYADFDKYSTSQTDSSGRFKAMNFFGYGRAEIEAKGLVAGSISGKFYSQGYQELGLSGITSSTESGLTASAAYKIDITVDGGSLFQDLTFTLSTNTKFGGSDGVLRKIQDAFDVQYYTAGNLFEKRVTVGIVNGDIRFTSGQRLSTSAILLADTGDAGSFLDAAANGRIPIAGDIEAAVAARLPNDTIVDKKTGVASPNVGAFFYDDGKGNISGACSGTINYKTGAIDLNRCPANAHFVVSANYGAAHSGGNEFAAAYANSIMQIQARSTNAKINTTIDLIGIK
jgi:hypothetical protein